MDISPVAHYSYKTIKDKISIRIKYVFLYKNHFMIFKNLFLLEYCTNGYFTND